MFLKNAWYVAALAREVTRFAPLARKFLCEDVVLFRTHNGTVAALEDRCPHRFAPLSMGRMSANGLVCGYHGMEFDPSGACVANPTQADEPVNPRACVRSYPVAERHNLVWIWMGDPGRADEKAIPDYRWYDDPDWDTDLQYMHIKGNYLLLLDNLFDLSHVNFVHGDVLGSSDRAPRMVHKTKHKENGLVDMWLSPDSPMVPGWAAVVSDDWAQENVDFWMDMHWEAPSNMMLDVGVMPVGGQREEGLQIMSLDGLTPETATSTHYFYGTAQSYRKDDRSVLAFWAKAQTYAFEQDKRVIEAVQERMGDSWDILAMNPIINKGDKASLLARRSLAKLIRQEQGLEAGAKGMLMTDNLYPKLLAPAQLGDILLENRVVMAPMTRSRAGEGDVATDLIAEYYGQRAGAGLIISEASQISPQGKGYPRTPGIFSAEQITGWRKVTERVHSEGGRIFLQLWHVGRLSHSSVQLGGQLPVAPSAIASDGQIYTPTGLQNFETPRALEITEIPAVVDDFRQAAVNAKEAGFDGVEIHAANGYIIDQFLRDGTNQRTDGYGGSIENRCRFLKEVVEAVIPVFGSGRTGVRLSPVFATFSMSDSDPAATFGYAAELLGKLGVAYLHVIQLGDEGFDYGALRAQFGGTYIANGGYSAQSAEQAIVSGEADFVAFGTPFIANPDLVARFRTNAELASFDPAFFYQGEEKGFTDYPPLASS